MALDSWASSSEISNGIASVSCRDDNAAATLSSRDSKVGVNSARGMSLSMVRVYMEGVALRVKLGGLYCKFFAHVFYF